MPHFLRLPIEVRLIVYEYCFVVEGEINPYPRHYEKMEAIRPTPRKPDVALLQVNHQVTAETEAVLYGKNVWRLSYGWPHSYTEQANPMPGTSMNQIRKLIISFDVRDIDNTELLLDGIDIRRYSHAKGSNDHDFLREMCHASSRGCLMTEWNVKIRFASAMVSNDLAIDLTNCFCPISCCRLVKEVISSIGDLWDYRTCNPVVTIMGCCDEQEAKHAVGALLPLHTVLGPEERVCDTLNV